MAYSPLSTDQARLRALSERIARTVAHVNGILTWTSSPASLAEMDEYERLRRRLGLHYDAINRRWQSYGIRFSDGGCWDIIG